MVFAVSKSSPSPRALFAATLLWVDFLPQAKDDRIKSLESTLMKERARSVGGVTDESPVGQVYTTV